VQTGYDTMAERHLEWIARIEGDPRERFLSELLARLPATGTALDLGCGAGVPTTGRLADRFAVTGVDISDHQLRLAQKYVPTATFLRADLLDLDPDEQNFDVITALYTLSHVPREYHAELFERIVSWLKPGGWFLASLGAGGCPDTTDRWLGVEMFFSSYDAGTNRRLLAESGLRIELDEIVTMREPEGEATFWWVLGQRA
jgi:SAM-dependent methyltransferase